LQALLAEAAAGATCSDMAFIAPREGVPLMQRAARRALELKPDLGEPYFFGNLADFLLQDKGTIIAAMRRALALSPKSAYLHS
jgi:hypothetical protein